MTMLKITLAFLCGILFLQNFSYLPHRVWIYSICVIALVIYWLDLKWQKHLRFISYILLGFTWSLWFAHSRTTWTLANELQGKTIYITGFIASIPDKLLQQNNFLFNLENISLDSNIQPAQGLVRLSWQHPTHDVHVGEKWLLPVHLKRIHGTQNPGGFDLEAWSLQQGIRANGYVVTSIKALKLQNSWLSINRVREYFRDNIAKYLPKTDTSPWITALAIGERKGVTKEQWQVLRNTGTNHLMAIAGLHIGFMSAFIYGIVFWIWRRIPRWVLFLPAQHAASFGSLLMALLYSLMAGFSIPTQRACIMFAILLIIILLRRNIVAWHAWSVALLLVLLFNPMSVLSESLWLSFGSVGLIIYGMHGRLRPQGLWWKFGRIQWVIALGLIPLSIWLFQQCSIISFIANSIAIPWVGFLIVPLTLVGCFSLMISPTLGSWFLIIADKLLACLWSILAYLSELPWSSWYQMVPNMWILMAGCIGIIILLLPSGFTGRWFGLLWMLPLVFYRAPAPKEGDFWFTLLDVGQGLAAVVQTQHHVLVFDAGPKLSETFDMGESVVLPYLRTLGAKKIDMLVISHGDNDHRGGAEAIIERLPVKLVKTSVPEYFPNNNTSYCLMGESWQWDGIHFEFLYPSMAMLGLGNDSSCVLKVSRGKQSILLTGDIEKKAEKWLLQSGQTLSADILVAPHHGSKTSAIPEFIGAVNPKMGLFALGYRNRYHFPHPSVVKTYLDHHIILYDTAQAGALEFKFDSDILPTPSLYRQTYKRYWITQ